MTSFSVLPFLLLGLAGVALLPWMIWPSVRRHAREVMALSFFQNGGYLPLTLAVALFPPREAQTFQVAVFFFIFTASPLLWSVGVMLLSGRTSIPLTPPFLAVLVGVVLKTVHLSIPPWLFLPLKAFGEAPIPLGMFLVGGYLAQMAGGIEKGEIPSLFAVGFTKAIALPLLAWFVLDFWHSPHRVAQMLWMEALMPSAVNTVVIAARYGGNAHLVARGVFLTHILGLIVVPIALPWRFRG